MLHAFACTLGLAVAAAHAFDPTPADQMRDMATDRPDLTESPITVDAGHLQVEVDAVVATFEQAALGFDFAVANLKLGLTPSTDIQLVVPSFGFGVDAQGVAPLVGDAALRLKWNLLGNDGGGIGLALMPWVSLGSTDLAWTAGLMVPLFLALPADITFSTMAVVDFLQVGAGYDVRGTATGSLSRGIIGDLGAYVETLVAYNVVAQTGVVVLSTGATWLLQPDFQLDAGVRGPVFGEPPRLEAFLGFSLRR